MSYDEDDFEEHQYFDDFEYDDEEEYEVDDYQKQSPDLEDDDYSDKEDISSQEEDDDTPYLDDYNIADSDPSDYGRVGGGGSFFEDGYRYRSARDVILARMNGIMGDFIYSSFSKELKNKAFNIVEKIPENRVTLYNIDVLTPATLYMSQYKKQLSKDNVTDFLKKTSGLKLIDHLDFIRYIRMIKNLENDGILSY